MSLIVPLKRTGSCGMIDILERRSNKPILDMSIPSILIEPDDSSVVLNSVETSELLPLPVLPTIPIFLDPLI